MSKKRLDSTTLEQRHHRNSEIAITVILRIIVVKKNSIPLDLILVHDKYKSKNTIIRMVKTYKKCQSIAPANKWLTKWSQTYRLPTTLNSNNTQQKWCQHPAQLRQLKSAQPLILITATIKYLCKRTQNGH